MKYFAALLLFALVGCNACSSRLPPFSAPPPSKPTGYSLALFNRYGTAHACHVEGQVITAAHVAYKTVIVDGVFVDIPLAWVWESTDGKTGLLYSAGANSFVDLALMVPNGELPEPYALATEVPQPGDVVNWVEYNLDNVSSAYETRRVTARVLRIRTQHIVLDTPAEFGASGGCLFNAAGEVVGIISYGQNVGKFGAAVAVAVLVVGLLPVPMQ